MGNVQISEYFIHEVTSVQKVVVSCFAKHAILIWMC